MMFLLDFQLADNALAEISVNSFEGKSVRFDFPLGSMVYCNFASHQEKHHRGH